MVIKKLRNKHQAFTNNTPIASSQQRPTAHTWHSARQPHARQGSTDPSRYLSAPSLAAALGIYFHEQPAPHCHYPLPCTPHCNVMVFKSQSWYQLFHLTTHSHLKSNKKHNQKTITVVYKPKKTTTTKTMKRSWRCKMQAIDRIIPARVHPRADQPTLATRSDTQLLLQAVNCAQGPLPKRGANRFCNPKVLDRRVLQRRLQHTSNIPRSTVISKICFLLNTTR